MSGKGPAERRGFPYVLLCPLLQIAGKVIWLEADVWLAQFEKPG